MSAYLHINSDGANPVAQAVLAYLRYEENPIEGDRYLYGPFVGRWENCREQGYVVYLRAPNGRQINIAFYEHRNTDNIVAVEWYQRTMNTPNIHTMDAPHYNWSDAVDFSVQYWKAFEMAQWIHERLSEFWHGNQSHRENATDKTIEGRVLSMSGEEFRG